MKTRKKQTKENITVHISCPNSIGPDEMQDIIAKAIIQADEMRVQREEENRKEINKKWHEVIGYKDYSNRGWLANCFFRIINDVAILAKIPLIPKKKIEADWVSWSLLKAVIVMLFQFITYVFLPLVFFALLFEAFQQWDIIYSSLCFPMAFFIYTLYGIFRLTTIEIDRIKDRNYLIGLFTAIVTVISVIIAVIAIIWGK